MCNDDASTAHELQDLESQYGPVMAQFIFDQLLIAKKGVTGAHSAHNFKPTRSLNHTYMKAA